MTAGKTSTAARWKHVLATLTATTTSRSGSCLDADFSTLLLFFYLVDLLRWFFMMFVKYFVS
jgi:hypothetical protein